MTIGPTDARSKVNDERRDGTGGMDDPLWRLVPVLFALCILGPIALTIAVFAEIKHMRGR